MATSCLFAAAVITVLSASRVHGRYDSKLYVLAPVSDNHYNGREIYWNLQSIERWNKKKHEKKLVGFEKNNEREDYSDDRLLVNGGEHRIHDRAYLKAESILPRVGDVRRRDGREPTDEHNDVSETWLQNCDSEHNVRNIKNDYAKWKLTRDNKQHSRRHGSSNEQDFWNQNRQIQQLNDDKSLLSEFVITRGDRDRERNQFLLGRNLLEALSASLSIDAENDETWREVRKKRSPKLTRAKIMKRQRRKKRRKEIRLQKKKMRIIKFDPEDENFVPSVEERKPRITYDYTTHEEAPRKDLDEEFVSKMPRQGELGEFGEGDTFEDENTAKEVADDDDKKQKKKKKEDDEDKPKVKKIDKPKGGKKSVVKPKVKKGGNRGGKGKKGGSKKGGAKKGKKDKGKGKKRKAAGRDTKAKQMLTNGNLEHQNIINFGQHRPADIVRAFDGNRRNVDALRSNVGSGVGHLFGSADVLRPVVNTKQTTQNDEAVKIQERLKVLADFREIFGQKNTVKLLMDKHRHDNNDKISHGIANKGVVNKINVLN